MTDLHHHDGQQYAVGLGKPCPHCMESPPESIGSAMTIVREAAHAKALAEALRGIIRDHALPRPIDWYPASQALAAYDRDHER